MKIKLRIEYIQPGCTTLPDLILSSFRSTSRYTYFISQVLECIQYTFIYIYNYTEYEVSVFYYFRPYSLQYLNNFYILILDVCVHLSAEYTQTYILQVDKIVTLFSTLHVFSHDTNTVHHSSFIHRYFNKISRERAKHKTNFKTNSTNPQFHR